MVLPRPVAAAGKPLGCESGLDLTEESEGAHDEREGTHDVCTCAERDEVRTAMTNKVKATA